MRGTGMSLPVACVVLHRQDIPVPPKSPWKFRFEKRGGVAGIFNRHVLRGRVTSSQQISLRVAGARTVTNCSGDRRDVLSRRIMRSRIKRARIHHDHAR